MRLFLCLSALFVATSAVLITDDPSLIPSAPFSYVVVGGGTAGLTVANRLTEDPSVTVLVIEAGPNGQNASSINDPGTDLAAVALFAANYTTVPQAVGGLVQTIQQGWVLGGSSSINGMQFTRGTQFQYDMWEDLGSPGWNWNNLQSCMKKAEHFKIPTPEQISRGAVFNPAARGTSGPVLTGFPNPYGATSSFQAFKNGVRQTYPGIPFNEDLCSGTPNGASVFSYSLSPGSTDVPGGNKRSSSANAYLYPLLTAGPGGSNSRPNLFVLFGHQAIGLTWAPTTRHGADSRATGVKFVQSQSVVTDSTPLGTIFSASVTKDVIVSAGALGSPHFLEISGIGNKDILQPLGIPVQVDLPAVGTNLQDQALTFHFFTLDPGLNSSFTDDLVNQPQYGAVSYLDLQHLLGPAQANQFGAQLTSTINQRAASIVQAGGHTSLNGLKQIFDLQAQSITQHNAPVVETSFAVNPEPGTLLYIAWVLAPQTRGTVHVASTNPLVKPAVNPNYLVPSVDLTLQTSASEASRKIFNTSPMRPIWDVELLPGAAVPQNATDAQWQAWIKASYSPVLHPVGTNALAPQSLGGVVSPQLIVYGTQNVRVVDSSIIPTQLSAHLSSTVYGIAEKAANIIKGASSQQAC